MWDGFDEDSHWGDGENKNSGDSAHPIKSKANDIVRLTYALVGSLDEAHTKLYGEAMIQDAKGIAHRFSLANQEENYTLKMEHAVLLKVHARSLCEMSSQLTGQGSFAREHEKLLHDAILELRSQFAKWVNSFDPSRAVDDGWGLFKN